MSKGIPTQAAPWIYSFGLRVFVHNASVIPLSDEGVDLNPGTETSISVDRIIDHNLPKPFSDCVDLSNGYESDFHKITTNRNQTYRQKFIYD